MSKSNDKLRGIRGFLQLEHILLTDHAHILQNLQIIDDLMGVICFQHTLCRAKLVHLGFDDIKKCFGILVHHVHAAHELCNFARIEKEIRNSKPRLDTILPKKQRGTLFAKDFQKRVKACLESLLNGKLYRGFSHSSHGNV